MLLYDQKCDTLYGFYRNSGKQCAAQSETMDTVSDAATEVCERSAKGQVKRPNRPEHVRAFEFLKLHYEEDLKADVPIQKSDVYMDYQRYCTRNKLKPLVAADFGRILKSVFPNAKDRRLGSRGCSKYCYVGVKRMSRAGAANSGSAPCSVEEVCKACEFLICEWASTVLSRRIKSNFELAKYLLKNRFVQTRSCAALTLTASLGESGELDEAPPMNKHRETQLKLQEKLKERLLNKQNKVARVGSLDETELSQERRPDGTSTQLKSNNSTPDPESQRMQMVMQTSSAPGSRRASPEHAAVSVTNSACTSPVFVDAVIEQSLYPMNYQRSGFESVTEGVSIPATPTPIHSQCDSAVGSERSTPIAPQYTNMQIPSQYMYDPRIQSCPTTPLPSYQQHTFDFTSHMINPAPSQCMSLPGSARNTPVLPDYQDGAYHSEQHRAPATASYQHQLSGNQMSQGGILSGFQRVEFSRANSAFIPIKDGIDQTAQSNGLSLDHSSYDGANKTAESSMHNDSDELEINELLDIIGNGGTSNALNSQDHMQDETDVNTSVDMENRVRSLSAQGPAPQRLTHRPIQLPVSSSSSVIYNLLVSGPNHNSVADSGRFRHHSGPQLGYNTAHKPKNINTPAAVARHMSSGSAAHGSTATVGHMTLGVAANMSTGSPGDVYSPPSTPNGNFRPVHDPNRETRMYYGAEAQTGAGNAYSVRSANSSPAGMAMPSRINNSLVGTMSPPAQPLKRKRNVSGERIPSGLAVRPLPPATSIAQHSTDYIAKRSLGSRLSSPHDGSQANGSLN